MGWEDAAPVLVKHRVMLEIMLVAALVRKLSALAKEKGRSGMWGGLGAAGWICGELIGFVIGFSMGMEIGAYGLALLGAAIGAGVSWFIVSNLGAADDMMLNPAYNEPLNQHYDPNNPYSPPRGA